ncbi:MAG TPA: hypothetical protein VJ464_13530 [Blastocatellia bacterium]|nr:hypothetical protein [Blastocatellia bacterium]
MNEKLETIRQACIKANPDIFIEGCESGKENCDCWWHKNYPPDGNKYRPICLADVLLAIEGKSYDGWPAGYQLITSRNIRRPWNPRTDDLTQQSEETINFLYELLQ